MGACIIWSILSKEKPQTSLFRIIICIPQNTVTLLKGCSCFDFTKRRLCTCTLPGIVTNRSTHTQLRKLTSFTDAEIGFFLSPLIAFSLSHTNARSSWLVPPSRLSHHLASPLCSFVFHLSRASSSPWALPSGFFLCWKSHLCQKLPSPGIQRHVKPPILSRQVASFWHGFEWHSLMSISQRGPV